MDTKKQYALATPKTARGYPFPMVLNKETNELIYPIRSSVIIRKIDDFPSIKIFPNHSAQVICVGIDPSFKRVASIDEKGKLLIWDANTMEVKATVESAYLGTVYDIIFESAETNVIFICGNCKGSYVKALDYSNTSRKIGNVCFGLNKPVITGVAKREGNETKFFAGGEDAAFNLYEKTPMDFSKTIFKVKNDKFISMARLSPDGTKILVVSLDKSIILVNVATGEKEDIAVEKGPGNHTLAIISVQWIDDDRFITGSLDKTIKIWSLKDKKVLNTIQTAEKPTVDNMLCNAVSDGKVVVALTLNGLFSIWNMDGDFKAPNKIYGGHNDPIGKLIYLTEKNKVICSSSDGKIALWDFDKYEEEIFRKYDCAITLMQLSNDKKFLYFLLRNGDFICADISSEESMKKDLYVSKGQQDIITFSPSTKTPNLVYALLRNHLIVLEKDKQKMKEKIDFDGSAMDILEETNEIAVGDRKGVVHIFDIATLKEKSKIQGKFTSEINMILTSPDGKLFAVSECQSRVGIYRADTKEEITYHKDHSSKAVACFFTDDCSKIISVANNGTYVVYSITDKKLLKKEFADGNYLLTVSPYGPNQFICSGEKCIVSKITY